ncbi:MAG: O-antigen ligase family protein [Acidobacteria bacterium]|nr:O-antigen ligase family protein [Acidobacteriota bacterium]
MRQPIAAGLAQRLEQALVPSALLVLVFATLTLGATPTWARMATQLAVLALLALWLVAEVLRGELNLRLPALFYPLLAIFLFACLQAFAPLSVYPPATRQEVWQLVAVGGFFLLLHHHLAPAMRLERFTTALLVFAFALAVFAILQKLSFNGKFYWFWEPPMQGNPFGPFINRNHYAAWVLMLVPLAWVQLARRRQGREQRLFWGLVVLTLGISILFSLSRAGSLLFVLSFPLYWFLNRGQARARGRWPALGLAVVLLAGLGTLALDTGGLLERWESVLGLLGQPEEVQDYRLTMWRDSWRMFLDYPWLGSGLETFGVLSDSYRSVYTDRQWLQAHNDYLQWLAETGLVGAVLAAWFLATLLRTAAQKMRLAEESQTRQRVVGALAGCLLVLLHSLVDFPLRIPANALLFAALWAVITAPVTGTLHNAQQREAGEPVGHAEFRVS